MGLSILDGSCKAAHARKSLLQACMFLEINAVESHSLGMDEEGERGKGVGVGNKGKSVVAMLGIQICPCPRVSLAWAAVLPGVPGSAAACANRGDGASTSPCAAGWGSMESGQGAAAEVDPLPDGFPAGVCRCDQERQGGTLCKLNVCT